MDVIVYCHTHWDREWYRTFEEFRLRLVDVFDFVLEQLESGAMNSFYFDGQTVAVDDYLAVHPEKEPLIKKLICEKKLYVGPWYVLADEFLVSGESLIRNLKFGLKRSRELGCQDSIGYLPDVFGHNSQMPKIFSLFGIKDAILWRGVGDRKTHFNWESDDNSSVFAIYLPNGYLVDVFNYTCTDERKYEILKGLLSKVRDISNTDIMLFPCGGDHLAPPFQINNQLERLNSLQDEYNFTQGSIFSYLDEVKKTDKNLETVQGELRDCTKSFILPGTYSARVYLKQANAKATNILEKVAEPFNSFLTTAGIMKDMTAELDQAWKLLLLNHPHDSICGCSVDAVHREMLPRYEKSEQISNFVISKGLYELSKMVDSSSAVIFNPYSHSYSGPVKVKTDKIIKGCAQFISAKKEFPQEIFGNIQHIPIQEDMKIFNEYLVWVDNIPAYSIKQLQLGNIASKLADPVEISDNCISNGKLKVEVGNDGLLEITDLQNNITFKGLGLIEDRADRGDTYNFCPVSGDHGIQAIFKRSKVVEKGPLRATLRLYYSINIPKGLDKSSKKRSKKLLKHDITLDVSLLSASNRVDFSMEWFNKSENHTLQLKFNLPRKVSKTFSEDTFGIIEREFDPDYSLKSSMPAGKNVELKYNTAPMQRFVWTQGLGVITEGLNEYGIDGNELYITVLRSVGKLSNGALDTRGTPAGPPLDVPEAQSIGKCAARYALCLGESPDQMFRHADEFLTSIPVVTGVAESAENVDEKQFLSLTNPNFQVYSVTRPENTDGLLVRVMNISSEIQRLTLKSDLPVSKIKEADPFGNGISTLASTNEEIVFKPFEMKSLLLY